MFEPLTVMPPTDIPLELTDSTIVGVSWSDLSAAPPAGHGHRLSLPDVQTGETASYDSLSFRDAAPVGMDIEADSEHTAVPPSSTIPPAAARAAFDKEWIERVLDNAPGHDRFKLHEPSPTPSAVSGMGDAILSLDRAVQERVEIDQKHARLQEEIQQKIMRGMRQLIMDNGADYRMIDFMLSAFERSRNTITDING